MGRLFGIICNEPKRLHEAIAPAREALVARGPQVGWGLGYVHGGEVLLKRHPRRTADVDIYAALRELTSDYIIAYASDDATYTGNDNTQPFRYKKWLFAQSGAIDDFDDVRPALVEQVPQFMRRNIKGKTPAEHVFHVFLAFLHDAGAIEDRNLPPAHSRRALRDAMASVYSSLAQFGSANRPGNLIVTNSRSMLAVRLDAPMYVRRFRHVDKKREEGQEFRAIVVVSDVGESPGEGFEEVPRGSVIMISRDLQIDIVDLEA